MQLPCPYSPNAIGIAASEGVYNNSTMHAPPIKMLARARNTGERSYRISVRWHAAIPSGASIALEVVSPAT